MRRSYKHCSMSGEYGSARLSRNDWRSRRGWRTTFVTSIIILLIGLGWVLVRQVPREPVYRGKELTLWLRTYASSSSSGPHSPEWNEADETVRRIRTNCIPVVLRI